MNKIKLSELGIQNIHPLYSNTLNEKNNNVSAMQKINLIHKKVSNGITDMITEIDMMIKRIENMGGKK